MYSLEPFKHSYILCSFVGSSSHPLGHLIIPLEWFHQTNLSFRSMNRKSTKPDKLTSQISFLRVGQHLRLSLLQFRTTHHLWSILNHRLSLINSKSCNRKIIPRRPLSDATLTPPSLIRITLISVTIHALSGSKRALFNLTKSPTFTDHLYIF